MTALAEAFAKSGVHPRLARLRVALAEFINQGGTCAEIRAAVDAIERMSGMGRSASAFAGHSSNAQTRQQVEGGEASEIVPQGHFLSAQLPSSNHDERCQNHVAPSGHGSNASSRRVPDRGGEDQMQSANHGPVTLALPVREPTPSQRSATLVAAKSVAVTIMNTFKIDGLAIGEWSVARARVEGRRKTRDGYILREAVKLVANAEGHALLKQVVKIDEMQRIRQAAEEIADAV